MTTAVKSKPAIAPAASKPAKILFQGMIAIEKIGVFNNIRKSMNPTKLQELTESVRQRGVKQAVLLRPSDQTGKYFLVDGHRRLKAATAAGLKEVPAIVQDLTAEEAAIDQAVTYLQREDLGPIEEALGFQLLTRGGQSGPAKYTVDQLAKLVDKSAAYVYRAMALLDLPKRAQEEIMTGRITPAHGHQILRVPPFEREALVKSLLDDGYDGRIDTATELRNKIEAQIAVDLDGARFPKDKVYAGMSACTGCPSNSGNHGTLFDGAEKGQCLNRQCFATKTKQYKADFLENTRMAHIDAKFVEYSKGYYAGTMRTGGYVVREKLDAKKAPKGDYGLMISSSFEIYVAVLNKKSERAEAEAAKPADPKEAFITEAIRASMYEAAAEAAKKLKIERKDWVELAKVACDDLPNKLWAAILGVNPDEGDDGDFEKASEANLRAIVLANRRLPYNPTDADWKKLGVDVIKVKKQATAEAEKEWSKMPAAKK